MAWLGIVAFVAFVLAWNSWTGARYFKMLRRFGPPSQIRLSGHTSTQFDSGSLQCSALDQNVGCRR